MTSIEVRQLTVARGEQALLSSCDLHMEHGERVAVLGPSGSGKTTLLRTIAGVERPTPGQILLGGTDVTREEPRDRDVAMITQGAVLQPHLTVKDNLGFPLRLRHAPQGQIDERVTAQGRAFSLWSLMGRRPASISEGERHEVALARSLVRRASAVLMDEPFSRVDPLRREELLGELIRFQEGYGITLLIATNDQRVALGLAHRLAIMEGGRLVQVGTPEEVYDRPGSLFVADFLGSPSMNLIDGVIERVDGRVHVRAGDLSLATWDSQVTARVGHPVTVGIRPECLSVGSPPHGRTLSARVVQREFLGARVVLHLAPPNGARLLSIVPSPGPPVGQDVELGIEPADVHLFDRVLGTAIVHGV